MLIGVGGIVVLTAAALGTGRVAYVATSGVSMNPAFRAGDLAVVVRTGNYRNGHVVAYRDVETKITVLHRIVGGDAAAGYALKGDHNAAVDLARPTSAQVLGRSLIRVPKLGGILGSPVTRGVVVSVLLLLLIDSAVRSVLSRQCEREGGTPSKFTVDPDPTAVAFDDSTSDREAETGTLLAPRASRTAGAERGEEL